jgi:hypothetical protein
MRLVFAILLVVSLTVFGLGQDQQPIIDEQKEHVYNVTLDVSITKSRSTSS